MSDVLAASAIVALLRSPRALRYQTVNDAGLIVYLSLFSRMSSSRLAPLNAVLKFNDVRRLVGSGFQMA